MRLYRVLISFRADSEEEAEDIARSMISSGGDELMDWKVLEETQEVEDLDEAMGLPTLDSVVEDEDEDENDFEREVEN